MRVSLEVVVWGVLSESLTVTLKAEAALLVGVPLMVPAVERANPAGREPEVRLQV